MCVICDNLNKVVSVSFIPGLGDIPCGYKVFFPWKGNLPTEGVVLSESQIAEQGVQADSLDAHSSN